MHPRRIVRKVLKRLAAGDRLDRTMRQSINKKLVRIGFGGAKRFRSMGQATNEMWDVLEEYGIEQGQVVSAGLFRDDTGSVSLDMAFKTPGDPFSPVKIKNSVLFVQWTKLERGYEVIAYAS